MFYKVSNFFGGVSEIINDRNEAVALFDKLVAAGNKDVELMEYTAERGGYHGQTVKVCHNGKVWSK